MCPKSFFLGFLVAVILMNCYLSNKKQDGFRDYYCPSGHMDFENRPLSVSKSCRVDTNRYLHENYPNALTSWETNRPVLLKDKSRGLTTNLDLSRSDPVLCSLECMKRPDCKGWSFGNQKPKCKLAMGEFTTHANNPSGVRVYMGRQFYLSKYRI